MNTKPTSLLSKGKLVLNIFKKQLQISMKMNSLTTFTSLFEYPNETETVAEEGSYTYSP